MMCVVNFALPPSQLQGVEWVWPGRREPDDEHSPASFEREDSFKFIFTCSGTPLVYIIYIYIYYIYCVCDSASELERWALLPLWGFPALLI